VNGWGHVWRWPRHWPVVESIVSHTWRHQINSVVSRSQNVSLLGELELRYPLNSEVIIHDTVFHLVRSPCVCVYWETNSDSEQPQRQQQGSWRCRAEINTAHSSHLIYGSLVALVSSLVRCCCLYRWLIRRNPTSTVDCPVVSRFPAARRENYVARLSIKNRGGSVLRQLAQCGTAKALKCKSVNLLMKSFTFSLVPSGRRLRSTSKLCIIVDVDILTLPQAYLTIHGRHVSSNLRAELGPAQWASF